MSIENFPQLTIQEIDSNSKHLKNVFKLANANSSTLGFIPYGAFRKLADKGLIIVCIAPEKGCIGYLLYNISCYQVKLTHLCVDKEWRGQGVAKALIKHLKNKTAHLHGISLSCRRDYNLRTMWESLGFVAGGERPGRSQKGSILTEWRLDYGHPNLLTTLVQQTTESRICAVIDANIFYDIADEEKADEDSKESKVLMADWLESELELCLNDEIKNEIDRNKNSHKREELRRKSEQFTFIPCNQELFEKAYESLEKFFPDNLTKNSDFADRRQLARVIGSKIKITFFITRDKRLLEEIEEDIYKEFDLLIIHPIDLILRLDELRRETDYQPIRLAGTNIERKRVHSGEQDLLINLFLNCSKGENKIDFQRSFRQFLSDLDRFKCFTVGRNNENPMALIVYDTEDKYELKIPIFRFLNTKITSTVIRHSIFECFSKSVSEGKKFTRITEEFLEDNIIAALQENSFFKATEGWLKANLKILENSSNISTYISSLCEATNKYKEFLTLTNILTNPELVKNTKIAANIERVLYPAKIADAEIPSFIIPIRAWWAKDLFDKELAEEIIWGANEELALRREVVYYCSKRALQAPGRILWYVSQKGGDGSSSVLGAIRACSRLDEIVVAKPKELHKRFRRLGIYSFKKVLETAKNDLDKEIMAVKFSDTELFPNPIKLQDIEQILNHKINIRSSYKLTSREFVLLYSQGTTTAFEK